ncbi:hypothetical protein [Mycoavidus cysteinexigens]|uniref:hypothetical protein n=1 Tax=Mycoavidus cysteinexigens TaxID=1553431 RepID=UPI0018D57596|nr:hypothetical protein [Mycoavidus cysteinexigens]GAM53897.1 hypothetical protein EBME_2360 [bacterium endosymbiont of Mortierella elongata FMR23-6]
MFAQACTAAGVCAEEYQFRDLRAQAGTDKADLSGEYKACTKAVGAYEHQNNGALCV